MCKYFVSLTIFVFLVDTENTVFKKKKKKKNNAVFFCLSDKRLMKNDK